MPIADEIAELFRSGGNGAYLNESVSQLEHALQAAHFAQADKAAPAQVAAALLHDVGYLLPDFADHNGSKHEVAGSAWLTKKFGPEVAEPVRLHVEAKRYLCATDRAFLHGLSAASARRLQLEGGPMTETDLDAFEEQKFYREAVAVARWDERARAAKLDVPGLETYLASVAGLALEIR